MPLYRVITKKQWGQAQWGNRYWVVATNESDAVSKGQAILQLERANSSDLASFIGVQVGTAAADGRTGQTYLNTGTVQGAAAFAKDLPIECCARITFNPGIQQPGVKYYRFALNAANQDAGAIDSASVTALQTFATNLIALGYIADALGGLYTSAAPDARVHTHQMYRAWAARAGVEAGDL